MNDPEINQIQILLGSKLVRERRQAIGLARNLILDEKSVSEIQVLLAGIVEQDPIGNMRELARQVLEEYSLRQQPIETRLPTEAQHMVGAVCPNGHLHYFDKRKICPKQGAIQRLVRELDGVEVDEIRLVCATCGTAFMVEIPCKGYK